MRRRSALGVIGGAVAAMASPLSFGAISRSSAANVSVREKYIRALVLQKRMRDSYPAFYVAMLSRYITLLGKRVKEMNQ